MKRLKDNNQLKLYLRKNFRHRSSLFDIIIAPNLDYNHNFANIIISKKNIALAFQRNLIKRRFKSALNMIFSYNYDKNYVIIVLIKSKEICNITFKSLLNEIKSLNLLN